MAVILGRLHVVWQSRRERATLPMPLFVAHSMHPLCSGCVCIGCVSSVALLCKKYACAPCALAPVTLARAVRAPEASPNSQFEHNFTYRAWILTLEWKFANKLSVRMPKCGVSTSTVRTPKSSVSASVRTPKAVLAQVLEK